MHIESFQLSPIINPSDSYFANSQLMARKLMEFGEQTDISSAALLLLSLSTSNFVYTKLEDTWKRSIKKHTQKNLVLHVSAYYILVNRKW